MDAHRKAENRREKEKRERMCEETGKMKSNFTFTISKSFLDEECLQVIILLSYRFLNVFSHFSTNISHNKNIRRKRKLFIKKNRNCILVGLRYRFISTLNVILISRQY